MLGLLLIYVINSKLILQISMTIVLISIDISLQTNIFCKFSYSMKHEPLGGTFFTDEKRAI